jgi:hypothetical protein
MSASIQYYDSDDDGNYGCYSCGALTFIYAQGSEDTCEQCARIMDAAIEADGGIDKCLNCGRYKSGNSLNKDQVCKISCRNPNEY